MKKQLFSLALAALMAASASAQDNKVKFSINAGPQLSPATGATAGVDALIPFGQSRWGFEPGVYWSYRHYTSNKTKNGDKESYDDKLHYINVPLRFAARVAGQADGPFNLSIVFGPYFAYGLDGTSRSTVIKDGTTIREINSKADAFSDDGRMESRFDYGLNFGLNAVVKQHLKLAFFTEIGLKDIYRQNGFAEDLIGDIFGITKINIGAGITVGYQF